MSATSIPPRAHRERAVLSPPPSRPSRAPTASRPLAPARAAIGLTFDDGPDPVWTPRILDALARHGARATFFPIAPRAANAPDVVGRILDEGHRIELHCHDHVRHTDRTEDAVARDTERALRQLERLGVRPRLWRAPWGVHAPFSARVADRFGLRLVRWDADTHDWRGDSAAVMGRAIAPDVEAGTVVLAHDGLGPGATRDGCAATVELIGRLAGDAHTRNLALLPLDHRGLPG